MKHVHKHRRIACLTHLYSAAVMRRAISSPSVFAEIRASGRKKHRTICLYSKHDERLAKSPAAEELNESRGKIRIEYRLDTSATVRSLVKTMQLTDSNVLSVVRQDVANYLVDPIEDLLRSVRVGLSPADALLILIKHVVRVERCQVPRGKGVFRERLVAYRGLRGQSDRHACAGVFSVAILARNPCKAFTDARANGGSRIH